MNKRKAIVIGAGIVGLATARALAVKGFAVQVFERGEKATGASGKIFQRAEHSGVILLAVYMLLIIN